MKPFSTFRTFALLGILAIVGCESKSQSQETKQVSTAPIDKTQITWNPNIQEALLKAKEEGKLLFVECYSPTCPVCQSIEPFFKNAEIATVYNTNFVNFKLDVGNAEQVKFLNERNIFLPSFPLFLFFDGDGKIVHKGEVSPNVASIKKAATDAIDPTKQAIGYAKRLAAGENSLDFLIEYASFARVVRDTVTNLKVADALFASYPKENIGTEESWKITKKSITDIDNGFAKYWFANVAKAAAIETKEGHADNQNNILGGIVQSSLYSSRGLTYDSDKLQTIKGYMTKIGAGQYADGVTWEYEIRAFVREGKPANALAVGNKMYNKFASNGASVIYITKVLNDLYPDKAYVASARAWLTKIKPSLADPKFLADYYFESARLHQRNGNAAAAKTEAQLAQSNAVKAQLPLERFNEFMKTL